MNEINLDEAKINYEGEWLSVEDLKNSIQEKMQSGEMKFAGIAAALEELNKALENSQTLEIKIVITKDEYQKLKALGGDDDREALRKAIMASIGANQKNASKGTKASDVDKKIKTAIKCPSCQSPIKISTDERPVVVECSSCGVSGRLTAQNKWTKLEA